jgi:aryl-alcohol dehydrogenase-like predicted oxidoreductase
VKERNLGTSGLRVSTIGLGCNNFGGRIDLEASRRVVHKALDLGVTLLDVADVYGGLGGGHLGASEECLGAILGERRKDVVLATKFGIPMSDTLKGASRRYIMTAVEASLRRLKTEWIDLYQVHRADPETPMEETMRALDDLVRQGKVRYLGCSNFAAWEVVDAQWTARHWGLHHFISSQDEYSLVVRGIERELLPAIRAHGLGLLPYFPLASGLLTGKYKRNTAMPAGGRPGAARRPLSQGGPLGESGAARRVLRRARPKPPGARLLLAAGAPGGGERHRRRHPPRADRGERQGRRLGALRRGAGGGRSLGAALA